MPQRGKKETLLIGKEMFAIFLKYTHANSEHTRNKEPDIFHFKESSKLITSDVHKSKFIKTIRQYQMTLLNGNIIFPLVFFLRCFKIFRMRNNSVKF